MEPETPALASRPTRAQMTSARLSPGASSGFLQPMRSFHWEFLSNKKGFLGKLCSSLERHLYKCWINSKFSLFVQF